MPVQKARHGAGNTRVRGRTTGTCNKDVPLMEAVADFKTLNLT